MKPLYQNLVERLIGKRWNIKELNASSYNHRRIIHITQNGHTCCGATKLNQLSLRQDDC